MIGHLAGSRQDYKRVTISGWRKVANTINWLTKTARKRPENGESGKAKDNATASTFYILYRETEGGLSCLRLSQKQPIQGHHGQRRLTGLEFW